MQNNFESYNDVTSLEEELREEFGLEEGFDLDRREPTYNSLEVLRTNNKIIVGLLQYDNDAQDFFENDDGAGQLIQFRNAEQRDSEVAKLSKTKKLFYLVNKYEHGNVHYSVSGTKGYPDQQWDVSHGCAVFIPCDYIQSEYRKMKKNEGEGVAYQHFIKDSNSVLDEYSNWCNGEVYGYSVITFDLNGKELDCDECWGFIGDDYANKEKRSVMQHIALNEELKKLMENITIDTIQPKELKLPFRVAKKDLEDVKVAHVYDTYVVAAKYTGEDNAVVYNWSEGQEKPTKAKFEQWQKDHGVSAEQFLNSRMNSDIKDILHKKLQEEVKQQKSKIKP